MYISIEIEIRVCEIVSVKKFDFPNAPNVYISVGNRNNFFKTYILGLKRLL